VTTIPPADADASANTAAGRGTADRPAADRPAAADGGGRATKGRAPERRSDRARIAVLHAADDLLVERGYAAVTIEGIAARAGVAKQTIYRWWPSKFDVLMDTFLQDAEGALRIPDTGTTAGDLRQHLRQLAKFLTGAAAGKVMLALIGQAQHDEGVAAVFRRRYLDERRALDRTILERGVARGEIRADTDRPDLRPGLPPGAAHRPAGRRRLHRRPRRPRPGLHQRASQGRRLPAIAAAARARLSAESLTGYRRSNFQR
jgi:AcrR family transcriptional regulator